MNLQTAIRRALPILKIATKLVDKIPNRKDNAWEKAAKILALLDAVNDTYGGGRGRLRELQDRYGLVETDSETFVRVFFATTLRDLFTLRRERLTDHEDLIEATGKDGERIFFRESHWSGSRMESEFYATPDLNFAAVIDRLWQGYPDGIYLSVTSEPGMYRRETNVCEVPPVQRERMSRKSLARLDALAAVHAHYMADGVHRCYLLYGPAGSGKSSFAVLLARAFGGRALKLDATALPLFSVRDIGFLIGTLRPRFLIIDDLERAPLAEVAPRILFLLERLKSSAPETTIVLSVNDPSKLTSALLRCGRIDVPLAFEKPERDETEQMVRALCIEHDVPAERRTDAAIARIIDGGVDLTQAYLADLCVRLRHEDVEDVLASVNELRALAEAAENGGKEAKDKSAPTKSETPS